MLLIFLLLNARKIILHNSQKGNDGLVRVHRSTRLEISAIVCSVVSMISTRLSLLMCGDKITKRQTSVKYIC